MVGRRDGGRPRNQCLTRRNHIYMSECRTKPLFTKSSSKVVFNACIPRSPDLCVPESSPGLPPHVYESLELNCLERVNTIPSPSEINYPYSHARRREQLSRSHDKTQNLIDDSSPCLHALVGKIGLCWRRVEDRRHSSCSPALQRCESRLRPHLRLALRASKKEDCEFEESSQLRAMHEQHGSVCIVKIGLSVSLGIFFIASFRRGITAFSLRARNRDRDGEGEE